MKWVKIQKDPATLPIGGTYHDWKPQLAIEGSHQCVYCAISETSMGGIRNFHVEHYRPKSKFGDLVNNYSNLFYACPICNTFKSNDWPNDPISDHSVVSYPNPSEFDFNELFEVDFTKGVVKGNKVASIYMQEKLFLNRPQLILQRRLGFLLEKGNREIEAMRNLVRIISDPAEHQRVSEQFMDLWQEYDRLKDKLSQIPHYQLEDVEKPK